MPIQPGDGRLGFGNVWLYWAKVGRYVKVGLSGNPTRRVYALLNTRGSMRPYEIGDVAELLKGIGTNPTVEQERLYNFWKPQLLYAARGSRAAEISLQERLVPVSALAYVCLPHFRSEWFVLRPNLMNFIDMGCPAHVCPVCLRRYGRQTVDAHVQRCREPFAEIIREEERRRRHGDPRFVCLVNSTAR